MVGFDFQIGIVRQSRVVRLDGIPVRVPRWYISVFIYDMGMRCIIPMRPCENAVDYRKDRVSVWNYAPEDEVLG